MQIINEKNKNLVIFLTPQQKELIDKIEKGEMFDLRHVDCDLLFGLPSGIRTSAFLALIDQGYGGNVADEYTECNVGLREDYRLCELPEAEISKILPKYVEKCAFYEKTSVKIFEFSKEVYIPVLQVYLSKRNLPQKAWEIFIKLPNEEIIEIMAHALVLSEFAPHVLKDLAKLPVRQQDEIRKKVTLPQNS